MKSRRDALALLLLTLVAFALRARHLGEQILGGDEQHVLTIVAAEELSLGGIWGHVTTYDFSIPFALLARVVGGWVPLDEGLMRAPLLLLGSLVPALLVLGARRFAPDAAAWLLGIVVAAHPFFIFYSRYVRPYGPVMLMLFGVLVLLDAWQRRGRAGALVLAAVLAALATWMHVVACLTVAWLWLGALLRARYGPSGEVERRRVLAGLAWSGVLGALLIALLYLPAIPGYYERFLLGSPPEGRVDADVFWHHAAVVAGVPGKAGAIALLALAVAGALLVPLRNPGQRWLLLVPAVGLPLTILALKPYRLDYSIVMARYLFNVLPIWMLCACLALHAAALRLSGGKPAGERVLLAAGIAVAAAWLGFGPYASTYDGRCAYAHHNDFQDFSYLEDEHWIAAREGRLRLPAFYESDLFRDFTGLILESPAPFLFHDNLLGLYQTTHGKPVKVMSAGDPVFSSPLLDMDNHLDLRASEPPRLPQEALAIVHKRMKVEHREFAGRELTVRGAEAFGPAAVQVLLTRLAKIYGAPVHEDEDVAVWRIPASG